MMPRRTAVPVSGVVYVSRAVARALLKEWPNEDRVRKLWRQVLHRR